MGRCGGCGIGIWIGGKRNNGHRYCNDDCMEVGGLIRFADSLDPERVRAEIAAVHAGDCPRCKRKGPVEAHVSHRVWSAAVLTSWTSRVHLCCRRCARGRQAADALFSFVLGWWGVPWGVFMTPVQITRNAFAMVRPAKRGKPSARLERRVKVDLARSLAAGAIPVALEAPRAERR